MNQEIENDGKVTDFLSFYTLPSTIMNHPVHRSLKAAYSFYNVHTTTPLLDLMSDALILAKSKGFDVFNALDLMENKTSWRSLSLESETAIYSIICTIGSVPAWIRKGRFLWSFFSGAVSATVQLETHLQVLGLVRSGIP
ncbi:hypothetical protein WMY93_018700 [Mugilogobius chulae]|uniref:Glycylpeptide N-tetradecanoyltransferase n=1 Tax=Mugilogobius chulae TaxID=88201 RepID=A0AAW0NRK0_9GOBI